MLEDLFEVFKYGKLWHPVTGKLWHPLTVISRNYSMIIDRSMELGQVLKQKSNDLMFRIRRKI